MISLCDFCGKPLKNHFWRYCIKPDGSSRIYPFLPEGPQVEAVHMQEELKNLELSAGGVYRFHLLDNGRHGFIGGPEIVEIDDEVASRCRPTGNVYYIDGSHVAEFKDYLTADHYGQPLDDPDESSEETEA